MKSLNSLALLLCLVMLKHYGLANAMKSKPILIDGLQWGSMGTYMTASGQVWHLEEDSRFPGNILFSSGSTLMTTDGKTSHLVAGSADGYGEGELAQAKFNIITGFLQTSSNQILVVDHHNHCLRYINRITNLTSQFVGNCTSSGFSDGLYRNARFYHPWSVISNPKNPNEAIVTDYSNGAVRLIDLAKGDVQTLIKGLSSPLGAAFDSDKENVFISSPYSLGKLNMKSFAFTLVPMARSGGMDGDFSKASFGDARGILCMNKVCLVADYRSHRLRILDVEKQMVYSICTGTSSLTNGPTTYCGLRAPNGLLLKSDTLYIGEYQTIRNISLRGFFPCEDITLRLTSGEQRKCIEVIPGHNICFTPGIFMYNIPEKNCTIKISITKELDACESNPCLNSGMCKAGENKAYTCACRDGWTGRNCQTGIDACTVNPCRNSGTCSTVNGMFICSCVAGWSGVICERELDICENNPCLNSGVCKAGENKTYTCTCRDGWTGRYCQTEARNGQCPAEIFGTGDPKTKTAEIKLAEGDMMILPLGRYIYRKSYPDNTTCDITVHVSDPTLRMRFDISAMYKLPCAVLNEFKQLTLSIARTRYGQIKQLSSGLCSKSNDTDISISCTADVLQVVWPTDCFVDSGSPKEKQKMLAVVDKYLDQHKIFLLDLVIPNHEPPVIHPAVNQKGHPATVVWTPVCSGGLKYMNSTETCN